MDTFIRKRSSLERGEDLNFQVLSWEAIDEHEDLDDDESPKVYKIYMFGNDADGRSVSLRVDSFTPFYYIKIPNEFQLKWSDYHTNVIKETLKKRFKMGFHSVLLCDKINIKGFTNNKKCKFLRLTFLNLESYTKSKYFFYPTIWNPIGDQKRGDLDYNRLPLLVSISPERLKFDIFEYNIEPFIRFTHIQDIQMAGWVSIKYRDLNESDEEISRCQLDYTCKFNKVQRSEKEDISNFVTASFDIECTSYTKKGFPDFKKDNDAITQIGTTLIKFSTGEKLKHIVTRKSPTEGGCNELDGVIVELADSEMDIVRLWVKFIETVDPDFIVGYNTYEFDWKYIFNRCKKFDKEHLLEKLSRLCNIPAFYEKEKLSTSAYGDNYFEFMHCHGITNLDLRVLVKREHKLDNYKLNNVAQHFTGDVKDDLSPQDLFIRVEGSNEDMAIVCKYCVQDTNLVADLFMKLCIFPNIIGMACIAKVPIHYVEVKGQQIKVFSQLLYEARLESFIVPTIPYNTVSDDSFTGATVLNAVPGAYYDPIAGLDFASLYPSIMIANNFCYSTIVDEEEFDNMDDIDYKMISWTDVDGKDYNIKFVQNVEGLLPKMLSKLWKERKKIKKLMKTASPEMYQVYDGQQLAIKVSMNSIYGFTGATFGRLPDKRIASAVTAVGRKSIEESKNFVEANYDCEVIYGDTDSIYVKFNTPYSGRKHFDKCFEIAEEAADKITNVLFKKPMELEFEKIMYPFYLFTKKRYATVIWTNKEKYDYIDYKGIQIKRRDSCAYVKDEGVKIFETLLLNDIYDFKFGLSNENIQIASQMAKDSITALLQGKVPINKLIVSKSFREGYSYEKKGVCPECEKTWSIVEENGKKIFTIPPQFLTKSTICPHCNNIVIFKKMLPNLPHVALAEKMKERDPFNCPAIGDRVPYVFIKGDPKLKQFEKVEDPIYAANNMLSIDYLYYFDHQLKSVLETIFEVVIDDLSILFEEAIALKPMKRTRKKTI
jgi:DNA polymerase delta subunit 1